LCAIGAQQQWQRRRPGRQKNKNGEEDDSDGRGRCNCWGDNADIKVGGMSALPFVLPPGTAMERERMTQFHSNDFRFDNDGTDDGEDEEGDNGDGENGGGRGD